MSPEGSQERIDALSRLREHGALGAAHLDVRELRAAVAAVRDLCADAQSEGVGMVPCCAVLAVIRETLEARP